MESYWLSLFSESNLLLKTVSVPEMFVRLAVERLGEASPGLTNPEMNSGGAALLQLLPLTSRPQQAELLGCHWSTGG